MYGFEAGSDGVGKKSSSSFDRIFVILSGVQLACDENDDDENASASCGCVYRADLYISANDDDNNNNNKVCSCFRRD